LREEPVEATSLAGIPVHRTTLDAAASTIVDGLLSGARPTAFRLINAYSLALAEWESGYRELLANGGVNFPDGKPVVIALNLLSRRGANPASQVRGPSLFEKCLEIGARRGVRNYFLGSDQATLSALRSVLERRYPGIVIAGMVAPPFRALSDEEQRAQDIALRETDPHIVWVGLGTPKQDVEAQRLTDRYGLTTCGVGAAFDFLAGTKAEAPRILRRWGLEWAFRLATEPRRLWRRYLFGNAVFMRVALRDLMRSKGR
jgi:N-acetylglucosaminyldiphosphoundecaprenol N-acetyl-beta-D-mannosaminyltransferase